MLVAFDSFASSYKIKHGFQPPSLSSPSSPISPSLDATVALIQNFLDAYKAEEITVLNLKDKSSMADYMILANGTSQRHLDGMADKLAKELQAIGVKPVYVEGRGTSEWVLLDAGDIIVHLFKPETRLLYSLEKIWGD